MKLLFIILLKDLFFALTKLFISKLLSFAFVLFLVLLVPKPRELLSYFVLLVEVITFPFFNFLTFLGVTK